MDTRCGREQELIQSVHRLDIERSVDMSTFILVSESAIDNVVSLDLVTKVTLDQSIDLKTSVL